MKNNDDFKMSKDDIKKHLKEAQKEA